MDWRLREAQGLRLDVPIRLNIIGTLLLSLSASLFAQDPTGTLRGEVQDASGARLVEAKVTVRAGGSALTRAVTTNRRGEFRIEGLLPGNYRVMVTAPGFSEAANDVTVAVTVVRDVLVTLRPQSGRETVTVAAGASSITSEATDTASAVRGGVVTSHDLMTIPLAVRSFANIAYMVPGTEPVEPSDPTKARITAVSSGGSSGLNNELSLDGGDNSDDWIGGFLQNISPEAIQEFAFRTSNEEAETGGTTAGSVVITTRHGTNNWHGDAVFHERDASLNARFPIENPAPNPKQPFSRQNYVGTMGGPIARDKLWVFASFEHVHENASIAYSPANQVQFDALSRLASDDLIPGVSSINVPSSVAVPFRDYLSSLRFDWAQSSKSRWFLRTSADSYTTRNNLVQQATLPSTGMTGHNNYFNTVVSNTYIFSPNWLGTFVFDASSLHLTQSRNSNLGFALAFPFSSTTLTVSGFETFGDSQFETPITAFPSLRNQEKYQFRYDVSHIAGHHVPKFGINVIHEPVLSGAFPGNEETLVTFPLNPSDYVADPVQFEADYTAGAVTTPARDSSFSQNVQRLALYAEDSWRVSSRLTVNYGLRWQTTFGLFDASGRSQSANPWLLSLVTDAALPAAVPHDYRRQFGPRLGIAYSPESDEKTVIRAGFGMYYGDLAQNGWFPAFQAVNNTNAHNIATAPPALIAPNYKTPYAIHATAGIQRNVNEHWTASADYVHEDGQHGYRSYGYPDGVSIARTDNRSSYNALMLRLEGNVTKRFNLTAHYTLAKAQTWGCVLGELFDYVNQVCDPLNPFRTSDYGPSGEDVRHRFVLVGTIYSPGGFEISTLTQVESARPYTITNPDGSDRIVVNGRLTDLDAFRGRPYIQADLRVARPIQVNERWQLYPFFDFFNLFNRNNPGANYVGTVSLLPVPQSEWDNVQHVCTDFPTCKLQVPVTSLKQLEIPAGGLGDFFGPGTTVGIPFAAQFGVKVMF